MKKFCLILICLLALTLTACAPEDLSSEYKILSPSVNPGGTIDPSEFIMVSAFTESEFTVKVNGTLDTTSPGIHKATVTVSDGNGYEMKHSVTYTVRSYLKDSLRLEAGTEAVTVDKFINDSVVTGDMNLSFEFEDPEVVAIAAVTVGTHQIGIYVDGMLMTSTLIIEDTVAPTATPATVYITSATGTPEASAFVTDIVDATEVTCSFKETYNFNTTDDIYVIIILTDAAGNETEITSFATCSVDTTPPVISGVKDFTVVVGEKIDNYLEGVTVTDNSGEKLKISVDKKRVNLDEVGVYEISYSATDSSGNNTIVRATVNVTEAPTVTEDELTELAKSVFKSEIKTSSIMTDYEVAYAIYRWVYDNIKIENKAVDTDNPIQAAYDGISQKKGDSFTTMAAAETFFNIAGISTKRIERLVYAKETNHYWLLVDIGDGWYHFDACKRTLGASFESFMRTDAELSEFCAANGAEYYYRYDKSKYPTRATESYYDTEPEPDPAPDTETPEDTETAAPDAEETPTA